MIRKRVAVLISGRGSNMQALARASRAPDYPAEIALVVSNRSDAGGLDFAKAHGIATLVFEHTAFASREAFDTAIDTALRSHEIELVACAGFMRVMTPALTGPWAGRMINIHPSLLPAYKGLHTHERVLADGGKVHGTTVHFVSAELDGGQIIAQAAVPVLSDDTPDILANRVLAAEHKLYPSALALVASGAVQLRKSS